jgi:hypothetical protein
VIEVEEEPSRSHQENEVKTQEKSFNDEILEQKNELER